MKFKAEIDVMPLKSLLDPQGKTVSASMQNVGLSEIKNVRIGKHITLEIESENKETLDNFAKSMIEIDNLIDTNLDKILDAPINTPVGRLDETKANRELDLRWKKNEL